MPDRVADIEPLVWKFLRDSGVTDPIYLQTFPTGAAIKGYVVRRVGTGDLPENLPIDAPFVRILARSDDPQTAFRMIKTVGDLLQGLNPVTVGPVTIDGVTVPAARFLHAELNAGPERDDDPDNEKPQWFAGFLIRVLLS